MGGNHREKNSPDLLAISYRYYVFSTCSCRSKQQRKWALGAFQHQSITDMDSEFRLDSKSGRLGTVIDLENALDLEETTEVFRVNALCRLGQSRRHRLDFSYFDLSRDATATIGRDIQFGDETFFLGTTVNSFFDLEIFKGAYTYSLAFLTWRSSRGHTPTLFSRTSISILAHH